LDLNEKLTTSQEYLLKEWHKPFGPALRKYAIYVAQSVFGDVQILDGQSALRNAKILLVPRVTNSDLEGPFGYVYACSGNLGVRWDFIDPKSGEKMFSIGIQSEASQPIKTAFDVKQSLSDVTVSLMTNLTAKTIQRFNASKNIQRVTGH
jgi:hypothetical protein